MMRPEATMKFGAILLALFLSGCAIFGDPKEAEFQAKKVELERQVELLTLQKRKAMLEKQLEAIQDLDLQLKVVPK